MNKTYKYTLSSGEKKEIIFDVGVQRLAVTNANGEDGKSYTAGDGIAISDENVISSTLTAGGDIQIVDGKILTNYTYPTSLTKIGSDNNGDYYQIKYHFSSVSSAQAIAQPLPTVPNIKICVVKWISAKASNLTFIQAYETDKVKADITNSVLNVTVLDSNTYDIDVLVEMFCTSPFFKITRNTDYPYHTGTDAGDDWHPTSYDANDVDFLALSMWAASGDCYCRLFSDRDDLYGCFYPHTNPTYSKILIMTKGNNAVLKNRAFQSIMYRGHLYEYSVATPYSDKGYYATIGPIYISGVTISSQDKTFSNIDQALQAFFN